MDGKICQHCQERSASRPSQLCVKCYYSPGIKEKYPSTSKFAPHNREPTQEEVDETVRVQSLPKNIPEWWFTSLAHEDNLDGRKKRKK